MLPWPWRHAQYRPRSCWASLNGTSGWLANVVATTAWEPLALSALLRTHSTFANFHQDCGNPNAPLEAFRLAQLLSNGCAMLSELSDAEDQRLYSGLLTFCNFTQMPACHQALLKAEGRDVWASRQARAQAFARRFAPEQLFERAGCEQGVLRKMAISQGQPPSR